MPDGACMVHQEVAATLAVDVNHFVLGLLEAEIQLLAATNAERRLVKNNRVGQISTCLLRTSTTPFLACWKQKSAFLLPTVPNNACVIHYRTAIKKESGIEEREAKIYEIVRVIRLWALL